MMVPFRAVNMRQVELNVQHGNGMVYLRHAQPLGNVDADLVALLNRCCERFDARIFLAERVGGDWRRITFAEFHRSVERVAVVLERSGVEPLARIAILGLNSIDHAVAAFAIAAIGAVVVPLSPAYLAHAQGAGALRRMALDAGVSIVLHDDAVDAKQIFPAGVCIALSNVAPWRKSELEGPSLRQRAQTSLGKHPAKIFFTSGSTGSPKGVINTHAMLTSSAAMLDRVCARLPSGQTPVMLDWLPWSHTFGGNVNVHSALMRGAALYIDNGAPLPGRFHATLQNLCDVRPTEFSSVPSAYLMLVEALQSDRRLASCFFERVRTCGFGGAALSASVVERFQDIAVDVCGERIAFGGGYGMTEACGLIALVYWQTERSDLLGLPPPGMELKLVEMETGRWECRIRGPNVFNGYLDSPDRTMFDEEGFFSSGDAVEFIEPGRAEAGLRFAGRLGEDFKLANGTWVRAGRLREELLDHLRPLATDLIVVGENRDALAALIWGDADEAVLRESCRQFNVGRASATLRIARLMRCAEPPNAGSGERTAKGTINMRRVIRNRAADIERLYANTRFLV